MAIMNESVLEIVLQLCSLVVRILVSATFISAGYFKIRSADSWFSNVFHTFDLRETTVTKSFFILLPWFEIGIGVMLLVGFILKFVAAGQLHSIGKCSTFSKNVEETNCQQKKWPS